MGNFKILFTDTIHDDLEIERKLVEEAKGEFIFGGEASNHEFMEMVKEADGIVTVYKDINKNVIEKAEKCKIIVRTGIGFNNIDVMTAGKKGIYVSNVPDYCFDEVSDHTIITALTLARKVCFFDKKVKNGDWSHDGRAPMYGFSGQTFGLLGFGNIPRYVAKKVQAFGFNVIAYDPFVDPEIAKKYNVSLVDLDTLFQQSDFVSLHAPLTEDTKHVVNKENLEKMKKNAYIVNTARGGIIDEEALYIALREERIAGVALDVMEQEPPQKDNPLFSLENVIITPHIAFYSENAVVQLREKSFKEAIRVILGEQPRNCVNKKWLKA